MQPLVQLDQFLLSPIEVALPRHQGGVGVDLGQRRGRDDCGEDHEPYPLQ